MITDLNSLQPAQLVQVACQAPNHELLLVDWLNAIVYVRIEGNRLDGKLWGQDVDIATHQPAVEVKGAANTELKVMRDPLGIWTGQCVVAV